MPDEPPVLLACIPARDEKNLAWAKMLGLPDNAPWLEPYAGSSPSECECCHGVVWVGPTQADKLAELNGAGTQFLVICHLCAIVLYAAGGAELQVLNTGTHTGYVPGTEPAAEEEFEAAWREAEGT